MARRGYPAEFRRRVIDLVERGKKVAEVSREFGISEQTIYVWRRHGHAHDACGPGRRVPPGRVGHLHTDHFGDLMDLFVGGALMGRNIPLRASP